MAVVTSFCAAAATGVARANITHKMVDEHRMDCPPSVRWSTALRPPPKEYPPGSPWAAVYSSRDSGVIMASAWVGPRPSCDVSPHRRVGFRPPQNGRVVLSPENFCERGLPLRIGRGANDMVTLPP